MATRSAIEFHEVTPARWADFERLFEARGGPKYCWCMVYRADREEVRLPGPARKEPMRRRVEAGTPVGILGYRGGEPVAWCSIAPKETFPRLGQAEYTEDQRDEGVWSLTCFFVAAPERGQGLTRRLVTAAVAQARKRGARAVEAYPVDPESPSYRFGGFMALFRAAGFQEVGHLGTRRHVWRRAVRRARA